MAKIISITIAITIIATFMTCKNPRKNNFEVVFGTGFNRPYYNLTTDSLYFDPKSGIKEKYKVNLNEFVRASLLSIFNDDYLENFPDYLEVSGYAASSAGNYRITIMNNHKIKSNISINYNFFAIQNEKLNDQLKVYYAYKMIDESVYKSDKCTQLINKYDLNSFGAFKQPKKGIKK